MKIGIDIGYGFTKAVNELGDKVIFPSLVAPAGASSLLGLFRDTDDYRPTINISGQQQSEFLVGNAARHSFAVTQALSKEKPPELHDPLFLTAAALLGDVHQDYDVAVVLPLAYYASQKDVLQMRLQALSAHVRLNGADCFINNPNVHVLPQGAAVLLNEGIALPTRGYVGVVDPGTYTTEFLLFEMRDGQPVPVYEACGSVEAGIHLVYSAIAREFQAQTGSPLPVGMEQMIVDQAMNHEDICYYGDKIHLYDVFCSSQKNIATVITQKVLSAWGNRAGYIQTTLLAGGGPKFFGDALCNAFPCHDIVKDAVFANAQGGLSFLK